MCFQVYSPIRKVFQVLWVAVLVPLAACSNQRSAPQLPDSVGQFLFKPVELPQALTFAGEKVPLEYYDVRENLDREMLSTAYFHSQTIRFIKSAPRYFSIVEPILKANNIPDDFKYLFVAESGFDPRAISPAKAAGPWQLLESVAKENGLEVNSEVDERFNIEKATRVACNILNASHRKYGSWALAAAAYNGGNGLVDRQMAAQKVANYYDLYFGEETTRYIFRILALKLVMENPVKYGFEITPKDLYPIIETQSVKISGPITDLAQFAIDNGINYKILKMFNPWLRTNELKNPTRKTYEIKIPVKGFRTSSN